MMWNVWDSMWDWLENVSVCYDMGLVGKYPKYVPKYSKYVASTKSGNGRKNGGGDTAREHNN